MFNWLNRILNNGRGHGDQLSLGGWRKVRNFSRYQGYSDSKGRKLLSKVAWQDSSYNWARQTLGKSPCWDKDSEILNPSLVKVGGYVNVNYGFTLIWKLSEQMIGYSKWQKMNLKLWQNGEQTGSRMKLRRNKNKIYSCLS